MSTQDSGADGSPTSRSIDLVGASQALLGSKRLDANGYQYAPLATTSEAIDRYGPVAMERMMSPGIGTAFSVKQNSSFRSTERKGSSSWGLESEVSSRTARLGTEPLLKPGADILKFKQARANLKKFIVVPGPWLDRWMMFNAVILFVTAYYEPYAVAVMSEEPMWGVILNRFLDIVFTTDLVLQFFIARPNATESSHLELWERDGWQIAKGYCYGWFWIDLLTVVPGWIVILDPDISSAANNPFALLRIVRLCRLTKPGRLTKLAGHFQAIHGIPFFVVELVKFAILTSLTCHWLACLWCIIEGKVTSGTISYHLGVDDESWLSALIASKGDCCRPNAKENPFCVYILSLYWATMTLTTVGYGDITPQNTAEYVTSTAAMIVVSYIWAYIIAKIVALIASIDPHENEQKQKMDQLSILMSQRGLPKKIRMRLREYLNHASDVKRMEAHRQLLEANISEGLQREVAHYDIVYKHIIAHVSWARDLEENAMLDLIRHLQPAFYGPEEEVLKKQHIVIVRSGVLAVSGRVLGRGDVWGEWDILLETEALVSPAVPRTLTFVALLLLDRPSLRNVCRKFPRADYRLRRAQIRTAVLRACCMVAKASKVVKGQTSSPGHTSTLTWSVEEASVITSWVHPGEKRLALDANGLAEKHAPEVTLQDLFALLRSVQDEQKKIARQLESSETRDSQKSVAESEGPADAGDLPMLHTRAHRQSTQRSPPHRSFTTKDLMAQLPWMLR